MFLGNFEFLFYVKNIDNEVGLSDFGPPSMTIGQLTTRLAVKWSEYHY